MADQYDETARRIGLLFAGETPESCARMTPLVAKALREAAAQAVQDFKASLIPDDSRVREAMDGGCRNLDLCNEENCWCDGKYVKVLAQALLHAQAELVALRRSANAFALTAGEVLGEQVASARKCEHEVPIPSWSIRGCYNCVLNQVEKAGADLKAAQERIREHEDEPCCCDDLIVVKQALQAEREKGAERVERIKALTKAWIAEVFPTDTASMLKRFADRLEATEKL